MFEGHAHLPGVDLWYRDTESGDVPVVFLHAATGSSRVWEHQEAAFVTAGFRVIAYDRRGFGRTVADASALPGTAAGDLEALRAHLQLGRVHLVGTAAGAIVALDYALSFPDRLRSIVLANTIGGVQDESYLELGHRLRPPAFAALPPDLRELGPAYRAANAAGTARWLELERASRAPGATAPQPMRNTITFASLERLALPTLLITGGADLYAPPPVMRLFAQRIRGASSVVVPEAGHSIYWEEPDLFNRDVLGFINQHR